MPEGCVREQWELMSPSMGKKVPVAVVLPPAALRDGAAALPVLYALHGMKAPYLSFTDMAPLREYLVDHPMLLVVFDGSEDGFYVDATHRPASLYTTFFFKELLPEIAHRYRTTGQIALTGFSMGGYGALHLMLEEPALFSSVSSLSGAFYFFDPKDKESESRKVASDLMGDAVESVQIPPALTRAVRAGVHLPPLLMLCGSEDFLKDSNLRFVALLSSLNTELLASHAKELDALDPKARRARIAELRQSTLIDYEYRESPGSHDWLYWKGHSREMAEFHWKHFSTPVPAK